MYKTANVCNDIHSQIHLTSPSISIYNDGNIYQHCNNDTKKINTTYKRL